MENHFKTTEYFIGGLRVYCFQSTATGGGPTDGGAERSGKGLFLLHGRRGSALKLMEDQKNFMRSLLIQTPSLLIFCLDHRNHGERILDPLQNYGLEKNPSHPSDMYAIQLGTAYDVKYLIQVLPLYFPSLSISPSSSSSSSSSRPNDSSTPLPLPLPTKWGILGISLGGHAALLAGVLSKEIGALVSVVGCGDYKRLMESRGIQVPNPPLPPPERRIDEGGGGDEEGERIEDQEDERSPSPPAADTLTDLDFLLSEVDPVHNTSKLIEKDILLLGGELDSLVPSWCNSLFIQLINVKRADYRTPPGSITSLVDANAKHEFSNYMKEKSLEFLAIFFGN